MRSTTENESRLLAFRMEDGFLIYNKIGLELYHAVRHLPVIDPHNHVDPSALAADMNYENIYQLWIKPDQYKSRAMRQLGVPEQLITGNSSDYEKYLAWAKSLKHTVGNPIFHWSCMELKQLFGFTELLGIENAGRFWNLANDMLQQEQLKPRRILSSFHVELLCTSDDLVDSLQHHKRIANDNAGFKCLPSLRGDSIIGIDQLTFHDWLQKLPSGSRIKDLDAYKALIVQRLDYFDEAGCLLSDHSLDSGFYFVDAEESVAEQSFRRAINHQVLSEPELRAFQSHMLTFLGIQYSKRNWKLQLHLGANRHTSSRLRAAAGPAGGYASIGNPIDISSVSGLLDSMEKQGHLPHTILYNLNPSDNAAIASLTGSFAEDGVKGKIQFGAAWWFNDHLEGIRDQLITLSNYGLIGNSIGMTTDSRSLLSFTRHNYFRRILCNLVGEWAESGRIPDDMVFLKELVSNICYNNIKNWINK